MPTPSQHLDKCCNDGIAFAHLNRIIIRVERQQRDLLMPPRSVLVKDLLARVLLDGVGTAGIWVGRLMVLRKDDRADTATLWTRASRTGDQI